MEGKEGRLHAFPTSYGRKREGKRRKLGREKAKKKKGVCIIVQKKEKKRGLPERGQRKEEARKKERKKEGTNLKSGGILGEGRCTTKKSNPDTHRSKGSVWGGRERGGEDTSCPPPPGRKNCKRFDGRKKKEGENKKERKEKRGKKEKEKGEREKEKRKGGGRNKKLNPQEKPR